MKAKKLAAVLLASVMALSVFVTPASALQVKAAPNGNNSKVYTMNFTKDIPNVRIQTPPGTVKMYSGMSWERLEMNVGVRLNVTDSSCGKEAQAMYQGLAAFLGSSIVRILDMDMEWYHNDGWVKDVTGFLSPIRVAITLPAGSDPTRDYAIISLRDDGSLEVLGDLDPDPATITVDSAYFDTFVIISGAKGAFDATRSASAAALNEVWVSNYAKRINSSVSSAAICHNVYSIGMVSDLETVRRNINNDYPTLEIRDVEPGSDAKKLLKNAMVTCGAKSVFYFDILLKNGYGQRITKTADKLRVTITVPFGFPAYADYALIMLNSDGSVSILRDIDANDSTITVDTNQLGTCAIIWGNKGSFSQLPYNG